MNVNDFYKYMESPEHLNAATIAELQDVMEAYPYFQTVHLLYLKSLYNQNNFKFNDQLKFSSVHLNNRKKLLYFLKEKDFVSDQVKRPKESRKIENEVLLEKTNKKQESKAQTEEKTIISKTLELPSKEDINKSETPKKEVAKITENPKELVASKKETDSVNIQKEQKTRETNSSKKKINIAEEIIQKRLAELSKSKKTQESEKTELSSKQVEKPTEKPKKQEIKKSEKVETIKTPITPPKIMENEPLIDDHEEIPIDLSDLIQIEAPAEYFLENKEAIEVEKPELSEDLESEKHSFSYWLDYLQKKKIEETPKVKKKATLIDNFLSDKRSKTIKQKTQSRESEKTIHTKVNLGEEKSKSEFMTETLAQIYIKQAYYDKAIEAYEKLSLKYPKKNTYFASQIKKIKTLQINS